MSDRDGRRETLIQELVELAEESAPSFPELSELLSLMAGRLRAVSAVRHETVHMVLAAVSRAFEDQEEGIGLFLLQAAIILTGELERDALASLREATCTAALAVVSRQSN